MSKVLKTAGVLTLFLMVSALSFAGVMGDMNNDGVFDLKDTLIGLGVLTGQRLQTFTNSLGMSFNLIQPGTFTMGSPTDEAGRDSDETQHDVTLTNAFYMQTTEVTQKQWRDVMGNSPSYFTACGDDCPVEQVSWDDIAGPGGFIEKMNQRGEGTYRLPTEAEWEYAARAGSATAFYNGGITYTYEYPVDPNLDLIGWYLGNSTVSYTPNYSGQGTHPAAQKQANAWGLYDMSGNVYELCQDWSGTYPTGSVTNPTGPPTGSYRVRRGASWNRYAHHCRLANREGADLSARSSSQGFRLVFSPGQNTLGMSFKLIQPGTFTMGSPADEPGRDGNETQYDVTLTNAFYMQTTEVTQKQWRDVMGTSPSYFTACGDDCPVEQVSWDDITGPGGFLEKMNQRGEGTYRLPTEAEWEYAARADTITPFYTGACLSTDQANYDGNYPQTGCPSGVYRAKTIAVGSLAPNAWGLYDMSGNVWEWCQDWYGTYPTGSVTNPAGTPTGSHRVLRGGSWSNNALSCRSAARNFASPSLRSFSLGFRLVFSPGQK
jgi:formylglycine-generating enzyme required for sulfatase activity